jgi:hypothetical protein
MLTRRGDQSSGNGKWKNRHNLGTVATPSQSGSVDRGDEGVWITCARKQEGKALREVSLLFDEVGCHTRSGVSFYEFSYGFSLSGSQAADR